MAKWQIRTNDFLFRDRLLVKCMGKKEWIEKFCSYIARAFPPEKIVFSPIYKDKGNHGYDYFCFVNILIEIPKPSTPLPEPPEEPVEPPEEPEMDEEV